VTAKNTGEKLAILLLMALAAFRSVPAVEITSTNGHQNTTSSTPGAAYVGQIYAIFSWSYRPRRSS